MNDFEKHTQKQEAAADRFYAEAERMTACNVLRRRNGLAADYTPEDFLVLARDTGYRGPSHILPPEAADAPGAYMDRRNSFLSEHCPDEYRRLMGKWEKLWDACRSCEDERECMRLSEEMDDVDRQLGDLYDEKSGFLDKYMH